MTPSDLKAKLAAMTPGPYEAVKTHEQREDWWAIEGQVLERRGVVVDTLNCDSTLEHPKDEKANAEGIAALVNAAPALIAAAEERDILSREMKSMKRNVLQLSEDVASIRSLLTKAAEALEPFGKMHVRTETGEEAKEIWVIGAYPGIYDRRPTVGDCRAAAAVLAEIRKVVGNGD